MIKVVFEGRLSEIAPAVRSLFSECTVHGIRLGNAHGNGKLKKCELLIETRDNPHRASATADWLQEWFEKFEEPNPLNYKLSPSQWDALRRLGGHPRHLHQRTGGALVRNGLAEKPGLHEMYQITATGRAVLKAYNEMEG